MASFTPQHVANLAWAFAKLEAFATPVLQAVSQAAMGLRSDIGTQATVNLLWAVAKLSHQSAPLVQHLSGIALKLMAELSTIDLSNLAWSYATMILWNKAALVVLGLFITAGSCIYGLYPWTAPTQRLSEDVPLAVVVDAGSTGTRVHIYCFSQGVGGWNGGARRWRSWSGALDLPCLSQLLEPLLNRAADAVPARFRPRTPLAIRATAGFRLLSHPKAELLLKLMRSITKQYGFKDAGVEVMSGDDEGLLQWLAVNRLLGTLRGPAPVAVLDLGGASTQRLGGTRRYWIVGTGGVSIAYLVDDEPSLLHPSRRAFLRQLPFPGGRTVRLYEHSYLGYGLVAARQRIMQAVNASKLDSNPCLPRRNAQPGAGATEGQGDAARCSEVIGRTAAAGRTSPHPPSEAWARRNARCKRFQMVSVDAAAPGLRAGHGRCGPRALRVRPDLDGARLERQQQDGRRRAPAFARVDKHRTRAAGCSFFFYGLEDAAALPAEATSAEVTPQRYLDLAQHACSMEADQLPASYPGRRRGMTASRVLEKLSEFGSQDLSITAWSFTKLSFGSLQLYEALATASVAKISEFGAQSLGNTGWAFAKRQLMDRQLMDAIGHAARAHIMELKPQQLSNLA
eukprot:g24008.t1